jgi:hypothetical protein
MDAPDFENKDLSQEDILNRRQRLKALIKLGKKRGYVLYSDVVEHISDKHLDEVSLKVITDSLNDIGIKFFRTSLEVEHSITTPQKTDDPNYQNGKDLRVLYRRINIKKEDTCSTCSYWIKAIHLENPTSGLGGCHKNPPILFDHLLPDASTEVMKLNQKMVGKFPYTHYLNWCGSYEYNELVEEDYLLEDFDFYKNRYLISSRVGYDIKPEDMSEIVLQLALKGVFTIGDWLSIRDYEQMSIQDIGIMVINVINATIDLHRQNKLDFD